jgi:hypothetical protein
MSKAGSEDVNETVPGAGGVGIRVLTFRICGLTVRKKVGAHRVR